MNRVLIPSLLLALVACGSPAQAPLPGLSLPIQISETDGPGSWTHGAQRVEFRTFGSPHDFQDRGADLLGTVETDAQGRGTLTLSGEQGLAGVPKQPASAALTAATDWYGCAAPQLTSSDPQSQVVVGSIGLVKFPTFDSPVWSVNTGTDRYDLLVFATRATSLSGSFPGNSNCHPAGAQTASVQLDAGWNLLRYSRNAPVGTAAVQRVQFSDLFPFQDD